MDPVEQTGPGISYGRSFSNSLLARYVMLAVMLLVTIFVLIGWVYVQHTSDKDKVSRSIRAAQDIQQSSNEIRALLWQAEFSLSRFLIVPSPVMRERTSRYIYRSVEELESLSIDNSIVTDDTRFNQLSAELQQYMAQLRNETQRLMAVRVDRESMFPSMPTIVDIMFPANEQFATANALVLAELDPETHLNAALVFRDLQHTWTQMVSEFRVFMGFRTGTFGSAEAGMPVYAANVDLLHESILERLEIVQTFSEDDDIGFQVEIAYEDMLEAAQAWYTGFSEVSVIQSSPEWRMDIPLLEKNVRPVLLGLQDKLGELDRYAESLYQNSILRLDLNAERVSLNLWFIALLVSAVVLIGFSYFRKRILYPVSRISHALYAEARGEEIQQDVRLPNTAEISDLVNAFGRMHEEVRSREQELEFLAHHDALTQLPNRVFFRRQLASLIKQSGDSAEQAAVFMIGLDRFKEINDTYGFKVGDELLQELGRILQEDFTAAEIVARQAGDEFALVVTNTDVSQARQMATNLHTLFGRIFHSRGHNLRVSASIGISIFPDHGNTADSLISRASLALNQAKQDHSIIAMYSRERDPDSRARIKAIDTLREALEYGQLRVEYQPQLNIATGEVVGFEALTRCGPMQKLGLNPQQMIDIAEETGLIHPLTEWLLTSILQQCETWGDERTAVQVSMNLSAASFHNPDLVNLVRGGLSAWGMPGNRLKLEITEGVMMTDPRQAERVLSELNEMDIKISIDDFGTGYSSLQYLRNLPVHELKIDRSFVDSIITSKKDSSIVKTIIDFAHNLEIEVVAEGVENRETFDKLKAMRCDIVQGYYISKAVSDDEVTHWLDTGRWQSHEYNTGVA